MLMIVAIMISGNPAFIIIHKAISACSYDHGICRHADRCGISTGTADHTCHQYCSRVRPHSFRKERQIVTISAVVAVFDMKFVITQQRINTTNVSMYGDG